MDDKKNFSQGCSMLVSGVLVGDLVILNALLFAMWHYFGNVAYGFPLKTFVTSSIVYLMCTGRNGVVLYKRKVSNHNIVMRVLQNVTTFGVVNYLLLWLGGFTMLSMLGMGLYLVTLVIVISLYRLAVRAMVKAYRANDKHTHKVVLVGSTDNNQQLYREMSETPAYGYKVMGYFDDQPNPKFANKCDYLGKPETVMEYLSMHQDIHELYCCLPSSRRDVILDIIHFCNNNLVHFFSVPNVSNYLHNRMYLNMLGNVPFLSLHNDPLMRIENRVIKRTFDIVVSLLFLCTLFPIILLFVTIITKITMPGPVFFRQKRTGIDGKDFYCLKFRSMKINADADRVQATKNDPRKTRWGDIMRKTNINEFPQFWNVLMGDMSIVGPRPHMLKHTEEYSKLIDKYMMRHFVKPGITGWSQVTGFRGETKELSQMEGRVQGDIWYIEHWSFWLDIYIMYKTVANVIQGDKEAY